MRGRASRSQACSSALRTWGTRPAHGPPCALLPRRHVRTALREPSKPGLGGPITTLHDCIGFPANGQRPEDVLWTSVSGLRSSQSLLSTKSGSGSERAATHGERQAPAPRSFAVRDRPLRTSRSRLEASPSTKPRPRLFVRGHRIRPRTTQCARALTVTPQTRSCAHTRRTLRRGFRWARVQPDPSSHAAWPCVSTPVPQLSVRLFVRSVRGHLTRCDFARRGRTLLEC